MNEIVGELVALVGGKTGNRNPQNTTRTVNRPLVRDNHNAVPEHRAAKTGVKKPSKLAASDHLFHKIAGKPAAEAFAHKAIPLGEDDEMKGFNS